VYDVPHPELGEDDPRIWREGNTGRYIEWNTLRKIKTLVEDAECERSKRKREGRKSWIKWITAIAAIIAALGGLATLVNLYLTYFAKKP